MAERIQKFASHPQAALVGGAAFIVLVSAFALCVASIPGVFLHFSQLLPDNYRYLAGEAMQRGDFAGAKEITSRRLSTAFYDFEALYLLAEATSAGGQHRDAAMLMQDAFNRARSAGGRDVGASGFQQSLTYENMAKYFWRAGDYFSSGEMARAAIDSGASPNLEGERTSKGLSSDAAQAVARLCLKTGDKQGFESNLSFLRNHSDRLARVAAAVLEADWLETHDRQPANAMRTLVVAAETYSSPPLLLLALSNLAQRNSLFDEQTGYSRKSDLAQLRRLDLAQFSLSTGARVSSEGLRLDRTGSVTARFDTGVFKATSLVIQASGSPAMGMYPVLSISSNDKELARLYLDGLQPREYVLPLWPEGAPKSLPLTIAFHNDAFDPVIKSDRNVLIGLLALY